MSPEQITALGGIIAAILGTATAWQGKELARLKGEVAQMKREATKREGLLREAIRYIRRLVRHHDEVEDAHRDGRAAAPMPAVPLLLVEEI